MNENEIMTELENLALELEVEREFFVNTIDRRIEKFGTRIKQLRDKIAKEQDERGMALEKEAILRQDL